MSTINDFLNWSYHITIKKAINYKNQNVSSFDDSNGETILDINGSSNDSTYCHSIRFSGNIAMSLMAQSQLTIFNVPFGLISSLTQMRNGINFNNNNRENNPFQLYISLEICCYGRRLANAKYIVLNSFSTGFPDNEMTFIMSCEMLNEYSLDSDIDMLLSPNMEKKPIYYWIEEISKKYGLTYIREHNSCFKQYTTINPPSPASNLLSFLKQLLPDCYFWVENGKELHVTENNIDVQSMFMLDKLEKMEAINGGQAYLDYSLNYGKTITIDGTTDKILNVPYVTQNDIVVLNTYPLLDIMPNRAVFVRNCDALKRLTFDENQMFICQGVEHSLFLSQVTAGGANMTTTRLAPVNLYENAVKQR